MLKKSEIQCIDLIGKGPFFHEYLVSIHGNEEINKRYSLMVMSKKSIISNKVDEEMVMNELYIRSHIRHKFLINQIFAFQDYDTLFYMTEYAPIFLLKSNLFPKRLGMDAVKFYAAEIFLVLQYLHSKKQIYTFLSPENVKIGFDGHIKLDYKFCNCLVEDKEKILDHIEYTSIDYIIHHKFTEINDLWSLGIVMFKLATGYTPFEADSYENIVDQIITKNIEFPYFIKDKDFINLVSLLLSKDKNTRETIASNNAEIIQNHPFFFNIDWKALSEKKIEPPYIPDVKTNIPHKSPYLNMLYTSDFIVGDCDGYGNTFLNYNTINFFDKKYI